MTASASSHEADREQLVAYLDGELLPAERQEIEERLLRDSAYREELLELERVWDLLDRLPRAALDETFARTTVEMVALRAVEEGDGDRRPWLTRRALRRIQLAAGVLVALAAGFLITRLIPTENERLLRDLPVIRDVEAYQQAGSMTFLKQLADAKLFEEGGNEPQANE